MNVQSALGETLRAEIEVNSITPEEAATLKVRVAPADSYRAAGVDYNAVLPGTSVSLQRRADGKPVLRVTSDRVVQEPFVDMILELDWSSGRLVREYTMLFDPPVARAPAPVPGTAPLATPAPVAPRAAAPTPMAPRAVAPAPAPAPAPVAPARPAETVAAGTGPDQVVVQPGDTLSGIAGRTRRGGVSLDQMLVSLYRANPGAFIESNMNRLRSGAKLDVPSAEQAAGISASEAKQIIQAQSADFGAYRERLASGVKAAAPSATRQAGGQVQAEVQDRKPAAAPSGDKLTLSKGAAVASKETAQVAASREQKDSAARMAELSKNVEELKKLQGAAAGSAPGVPGAKPGVALGAPPVAAPVPAPAPVAAPAPAPAVVATAPATAASPAAAATPAPVVAPAPAPIAAASAPETSAASVPAPATPVARPAPAPAPAVEEPGALGGLLENPLLLPIAGLLVALMAAFGFYRLRRQGKSDSAETSFLESRLQPDSFFGASGGQRVDTRDATGVPSSMSYSLSQLDAIGDVDPVAEADVYLAYGRDLQAEEILKEAMRANPERMAIRGKLLEVYAKRRDSRGFEPLATQLFALTGGVGEDWLKAQELGRSIDAENPMYQSGGRPASMPAAGGGAVVEPLGASTMPQSVLPTPSGFNAQRSAFGEDPAVDLDLDVSQPGKLDALAPSMGSQSTQPFDRSEFGAAAATPPAEPALDFDLQSFSLEPPASAPAVELGSDLPDLSNLDLPVDGGAGASMDDALARKLDLADEFRQIGDKDGARDLLQEVASKATGALKAKAKGMLDELG
ncbi:FimV/HubP family polar landmark protein [Rivibacter subsaxonicus]|nr:FimV/HubP family polar landmark protein [Rivibacter subsaxonicus]